MNPTDTTKVLNQQGELHPLTPAWFLNGEPIDEDLRAAWIAERPSLFSQTRVWVTETERKRMADAIKAIETVLSDTRYQQAFAERFNTSVPRPLKTPGVLYGYDFHLSADGPKLIEINTNAGGAFLTAALGDAWLAHDPVTATSSLAPKRALLRQMFEREWQTRFKETHQPMGLLVIVDEEPETQYLYPEFVLCANDLTAAGWKTAIADPSKLVWDGRQLLLAGQRVDMVYNRLTDFYLQSEQTLALRMAYEADAVLLTPAPEAHAHMADKRHLVSLADSAALQSLGFDSALCALIAQVVQVASP